MAERALNAGMLDRRIVIETPSPTALPDGYNQSITPENYEEWARCYGGKSDQSGDKEGFGGIEAGSDTRTVWFIRFRTPLPTAQMRLYEETRPGEVYQIETIREVGRRQWLKLLCTLRQ